MLLFQHRVCLSRFVFVYLMTRFLCSTAYGHCKRKIPAQWVCDSMDESKGRFASWGWVILLLLRTPEKTLSHWRVGRACADSVKQFIGKVLICSLKLSGRHRAVLILPDLSHPEPCRENTFWVPSWSLSVSAVPARAEVKQGDFLRLMLDWL